LLIGENSSGKSTFLAAMRILIEVLYGSSRPSFNEEPFLLGSFEQIAHAGKGRRGRSKSFQIGVDFNLPRSLGSPEMNQAKIRELLREADQGDEPGGRFEVKFREVDAHPQVDQIELSALERKITLTVADNQSLARIELNSPNSSMTVLPEDFEEIFPLLRRAPMAFDVEDITRFLEYRPAATRRQKPSSDIAEYPREDLMLLRGIARWLQQHFGGSPYAAAPVRTRPRRTYDPVKEAQRPEGDHVPMALARIFATKDPEESAVLEGLNKYGKASGMFDEILVKHLGKSGSDPFQIKISTSGVSSNLLDVGYGVSQVLPILVDVLQGRARQYYLLQQPEVHLHPKSQAELGSFFVDMAKRNGRHFVIETHSDAIIDRVRIEVKNGKLPATSVSLLFFERTKGESTIHNMSLDQEGNLLNAPSNYRAFFLEEEKRILGV